MHVLSDHAAGGGTKMGITDPNPRNTQALKLLVIMDTGFLPNLFPLTTSITEA